MAKKQHATVYCKCGRKHPDPITRVCGVCVAEANGARPVPPVSDDDAAPLVRHKRPRQVPVDDGPRVYRVLGLDDRGME